MLRGHCHQLSVSVALCGTSGVSLIFMALFLSPLPLRACGVDGEIHDPIRHQPLQEQQEEEVQHGHKRKDGASDGAAVSPQPP